MVIIDTVINTILSRLTLDPAGMHCPSWDDAFVSNFPGWNMLNKPSTLDSVVHSLFLNGKTWSENNSGYNSCLFPPTNSPLKRMEQNGGNNYID